MFDLYPIAEPLFVAAMRLLGLDVRARDAHHIPSTGPAIVASNHVGYLDFAFVALSPPPPRRRVRFVARHEIFAHRIVGPLMRALRQIEADPYGDPERAFRQALAALRAGEIVGIHPEGTISPSFVPRPAKTGAVRMALETGAPIVPCAVWGSHRLLTKWRPRNLRRGIGVLVWYGEPWHPQPADDPREATRELMRRISVLLGRAQDAYWQQPQGSEERWWIPAHRGGTAPTPEQAEQRLREQHAQRARRRAAELGDGDEAPEEG